MATLYDRKKGKLHTSITLYHRKNTLAQLIGSVLVTTAFVIFIFMFTPIVGEEIKYQKFAENYVESNIEAQNILVVKKEAESLGISSNFGIYIPKINAKSNIIANVDAGNEEEYRNALKKGVAHALGTYFPGQGRMIYMFAHSTDIPANIRAYNAVFFLLRKLETGDTIEIFFADQKYVYSVTEVKVVEATDTDWFTKNYGSEVLILQTCWPPGTSWKRLVVVAQPFSS